MYKGIKAKDIRDFEKAVKRINEVVSRISEYYPEVEVYVAKESMFLMNGPHHDVYRGGSVMEENIVTSANIDRMDCGDW